MKKYLLGFLAVGLAVGLSSFNIRSSKHVDGELYWFQIGGQYNPNATVASADASYVQFSVLPPSASGCSGSSYQCLSGFASSDVVSMGSGYILNGNSQQPEQQPNKKN